MKFEIFLVFLLSYISGSIPFGLILAKTFLNKDIRKTGSKNIGATNVLRTGNKSVAILTLLLDIFKGVVPILVTKIYFPNLIYLSGLAAFLGHIFPVWLKFKGGKGVATYLGIIKTWFIFLCILDFSSSYNKIFILSFYDFISDYFFNFFFSK